MAFNKLIRKRVLSTLLLAFIICTPTFLRSQGNKIRFDHIDIKDGLSQNTILCIYRDSRGFMWFGTEHGLNRYDGRDVRVFLDSDVKVILHEGEGADAEIKEGKFGNQINDICEDKNGNIWLATDQGLFRFNPVDESFHTFSNCLYDKPVQAVSKTHGDYLWVGAGKELTKVNIKGEKYSPPDSRILDSTINTLYGDNNEDLWIGTEKGLLKKEKSTSEVKEYDFPDGQKPSILTIFEDKENTLWVGTKGGFLFFRNKYNQFQLKARFTSEVRAIADDGKRNLWIGLYGDGVAILPKTSSGKKTTLYLIGRFYHPKSLYDNFVQSILHDKDDTFWVGTFGGGINKYNPKKEKFTSYFTSPGVENALTENNIFSLCEDKNGIIWIGSITGELDIFDPASERFQHFKDEPFRKNAILSICEDDEGKVWIGTDKGGFFRYEKSAKDRFIEIGRIVLGETRIRIIKKDQNTHYLWIGTQEKGVLRFNPKEEKSDREFSFTKSNGLSDNNIYCILPDENEKNIIWIGTAVGLDRLDKQSREITKIKYTDIVERKVYSIIHDPDPQNDRVLWLGTGRGLCKFNKDDKQINTIKTTKDGLPNDVIYGILTDNRGYLWLSTNHGISKFDPKKEKVVSNFDENDGLQGNEFNSGAYCKTESGLMYFGGIQGLSVFQPEMIEIDETTPPIYFTNLKIHADKEIKPLDHTEDGRIILTNSISSTKMLELNYQDQPIRLDFAAMDYKVPRRVKYKFELKEGDKLLDKKDRSKENFYILSNRDSGRYTFKVWSSNSDEQFSEDQTPAQIEIIIIKNFSDYLKPLLTPIILVLSVSTLLIAEFYLIFRFRAKKRTERLEKIETAIDDVSRKENIEEVALKILDGIVYSFGFDYATVSTIDFMNSRINTIAGKSRMPNIVNPDDWKDLSNYSLLDDTDILVEVVKNKKTIKIVGPEIDIDKDKRLNKEIFKNYNHQDLIRLFVPIEYRKKNMDIPTKEDVVLGVVEAGFHKSSMKSKMEIWTRAIISKEVRILLELFISFCGAQLHKALKVRDRQMVDDILEKSAEIEHHRKYLENILEDAVILVGGDKGDISFLSFNEKQISLNDNPIFYNIGKEDKKSMNRSIRKINQRGIVSYVVETNHYYYSGDVKNDTYYIEEFEEVNSELAVPIRYSGWVIAVLNIYSTKKDFFDERKANIIQDIADETGKIFQKKKMNQTLKNLALPFDLFTGIDTIYNSTINSIRDYFITEYVSIWERTEKEGVRYELKKACNKLEMKYKETGLTTLKEEIFETNSRNIQLINFEQDYFQSGFEEFAKRYDFHAMILIPIIVDKQIYGFINIFSRRNIPYLFTEDRVSLDLIASKSVISAQYEKLISSFLEVSNSLPSENLFRIINIIAENAGRVLHADPVIFFKYEPDREICGAIIYGSFLHPLLKKIINNDNIRKDHLALFIIRDGSVWFENADEYREYIGNIDRKYKGENFDQDFWTREKIKSSAGIRLEHNGKPAGVMFFNYREEQRFDKDTRRFIEAFSSIASSAIVNANNLDLIAKQKQELEEQKSQILIQNQKLEFEYEEIYRKMHEMLPRATRTSFYLILDAVNHDIRNCLIRLKQTMMDIEEGSHKLQKTEREKIRTRFNDLNHNIRNVTNLMKLFNFRESGKKSVDINELIKELIFFFKTKESESLRFITDKLNENIPPIRCHQPELSMIVYNLLSNSVFAISNRTNQIDPIGKIEIETDFNEEEYIIIVEDNGTGIDVNDINHIFEAGFSTKKEGMGIGLYFVTETLREHFYGTIVCKSQYGGWTRFIIKIPMSVNYKED